MSSWYFNPIGGNVLLVLVALAILAAAFAVGMTPGRTSRGRRLVLLGLRAAVFLLLLLAMLRPTRIFTELKKQSATLIVLVDRSRSMMVPDSFGGRTRWQSLREAIDEALPTLRDLQQDLEVKVYAFDAEIAPVELLDESLPLDEEPSGNQTAIGSALDDVLRREAGKRLAGIILLSDGAQQAYAPRDLPPETPARRVGDLGYPLYTVVFGQPYSAGQSRDMAVKDLQVNQTVFVKNELTITGTAVSRGYVNKDVPAQVLFETSPGKMTVVDTVTLRAKSDGEQLPIRLSYTPQVAGEHKLTLRIANQDGELVTSNNELSTFVTVLTGGLKVLYLEGQPRVEQKFLRRSLNASPDIQVDFRWFDHRDRSRWPLDLHEYFEPGQYDVYILGDLDAQIFREPDLQALGEAIGRGSGFIMLGGFHSFWGGGYQDTPLARVLPVQPDKFERASRQQFDLPLKTRLLHLEAPVRMLPSRRFGTTSLMLLAPPAENRQAWEKLPPLEGANQFSEFSDTAKVLAETADGKPLLVAGEFGAGRVLAFGGDSTWHWWMQGQEAAHRRFWRQVVLWLARKDESDEGKVWIKLDQRRFTPGRQVDFTGGANSPEGIPIGEATFEAQVTLPDGGRRTARLTRHGETISGAVIDTQQAGEYSIALAATQTDGTSLGTARARFIIDEQDLELDNPAARPALMANLAKMTEASGGRSLAPEQLSDLLEKLREQPPDLEVETQIKQTPWDSPPFFLLVVGLMCAEWFLRKKWGLV